MSKIKTSRENKTGRNTHFEMSRAEFARQIKKGLHPNYHLRNINGVETPCANPDKSKNNNLG